MKMLSSLALELQRDGSAAAPAGTPASRDIRPTFMKVPRRPAPLNRPRLVGDAVICSIAVMATHVVAMGDTTSPSAALVQASTWAAMLLVPVLILAFH